MAQSDGKDCEFRFFQVIMPTYMTHLCKKLLFGDYKILLKSPAENLYAIIILMQRYHHVF